MSRQPSDAPKAIAPPPAPADVGLVAALAIEISPFLAKLKNVRKYSTDRHTVIEGELAGKVVAVIVTGPGRIAALRGATHLLGGHRPHCLISAGFGGALDLDLRRKDIVIGREVVSPEGERLQIEFSLDEDSDRPRLRAGTIATVDEIVRTAEEKAALRAKTGACVVDMETSAIAQLCAERNVRLIPIRIISDEAGVDLPPEIATILGRSGGYRVGAAVGAIWKRPSSVLDLLALREHANSAAGRLAVFLPGVIAKL
jgi:adenosylhomocysteine nucleosidase